MSIFKRHKLDRIGIISSGLCALHCAAIPVLLSFGVIGTFDSGMHLFIEWMVLICSVIFGSWSIFSALQSHGRIWPQVLIGAGVMIIILGLLLLDNHIAMAAGGILLLSGHWANWRFLEMS